MSGYEDTWPELDLTLRTSAAEQDIFLLMQNGTPDRTETMLASHALDMGINDLRQQVATAKLIWSEGASRRAPNVTCAQATGVKEYADDSSITVALQLHRVDARTAPPPEHVQAHIPRVEVILQPLSRSNPERYANLSFRLGLLANSAKVSYDPFLAAAHMRNRELNRAMMDHCLQYKSDSLVAHLRTEQMIAAAGLHPDLDVEITELRELYPGYRLLSDMQRALYAQKAAEQAWVEANTRDLSMTQAQMLLNWLGL